MLLYRYGRPIQQLGERYELLGLLGSGGMADVCLALDEVTGQDVAIKIIKNDGLSQRTLNRFMKEAAQIARWDHPHILRVYSDLKLELLDAAQGSIIPYIVMEHAAGGDLQKRLIPEQPYSLSRSLTIFEQLCSAVAYAHDHGIIHRDLKPLNILFRVLEDAETGQEREQVVLADFGLAVEIDVSHQSFAQAGTIPYMAPEQLRGAAEPASDIFALGVILYQLLTGKLPFVGSWLQRAYHQPTPVAPSALNARLPRPLDAVILRSLHPNVARRYADAGAFSDAVTNALQTLPIGETRPRMAQAQRSKLAETGKEKKAPYFEVKKSSLRSDESRDTLGLTYVHDGGALKVEAQSQARELLSSPHAQIPISDPRPLALPARKRRPRSEALVSGISAPLRVRRRVRQRLMMAGGALVGILLVAVLAWVAAPMLSALAGPHATITVIPDVETVSAQVAFMGVPTPGSAGLVRAREVIGQAEQVQVVNGTGMVQIEGQRATGVLTFFNGSATAFTVAAGTQITVAATGAVFITDALLTVPAGNPPDLGSAGVSAHAAAKGAAGNIRANTINQTCCTAGNFILVKNVDAFTGGQDSAKHSFLQQSDVDAVVNALEPGLVNAAKANLGGQKGAGEDLVQGSCEPQVGVDEPVGDTGKDIQRGNLTLTVVCKGVAFDGGTVRMRVMGQLEARAKDQLGDGYVRMSEVGLDSVVASADLVRDGSVGLTVTASARWGFELDGALRLKLLRAVAGKTRDGALAILRGYRGIKEVRIDAGGEVLPDDVGRIVLEVGNEGN